MATVLTTEAEVFGALANRYTAPEWALFSDVANSTGGRATRRIDALAMGLWPSRGMEVLGFEIKTDRGDFQRELKNPAKAEAIAKYCNRWWVAAGSKDIAKPEELPLSWGLMVPHGKTMKIVKDAGPMEPVPLTRGFVAALVRSAHGTIETTRRKVRTQVYYELEAEAEERFSRKVATLEESLKKERAGARELQTQLHTATEAGYDASTIGRAIQLLHRLEGWSGALTTLSTLEDSMRRDSERLSEVGATLNAAGTLLEVLAPKKAKGPR